MTMESSGATITSGFVKGKLIQEDIKRLVVDQRLSGDAAFVANKRNEPLSRSVRGMNLKRDWGSGSFRCFGCNELGHKAWDCPKRHGRGQSRDGDWSLLTALSANGHGSDWYVDLGATSHMRNCKDWLEDYHVSAEQEVTCANNEKLSAIGTGNVKVQVGGMGNVRTIQGVAYVPNLSTNLLSVSAIVKKGMVAVFTVEGKCD